MQRLASVATAKGKAAIDSIYGVHRHVSQNFTQTLAMVFSLTRSVARVGFNEKHCQKLNIAYLAAKVTYDKISRTVAADNMDGFLKLIVTNDGTYTILGVCAVGASSSTLVNIGSVAI
uniref:Dihydrolipoyl dehydrogenase n=1 Tax=Lygus hesperus TaxID=30085 RepID=A0A0A9XDJ3_LYGHE